MALLFCDGCDAYSTATDIASKWSATADVAYTSTGGRFGGGALENSASQYAFGVTADVNIASGATFYVGFSVKLASLSSPSLFSETGLVMINPPQTKTLSSLLGINSSGALVLQGLTSSTALATGPVISGGGWHWVEASFTINGSSSSSTCYVDGVQAWSGSSYAFGSSAAALTQLSFGGPYSFATTVGSTTLDDIIIWDTTGSGFNTFPLGPRRIGTLNPSAAGHSTQFTPTPGTNANWQSVLSYANANSDTDYVQDASTGNVDLYATPGLTYTPEATINAVVLNTYAQDPSGSATRTHTPKIYSGATPTTANGTARVLGANYTSYQDCFVNDSTGTAWSATTVNSAQPGMGD